MSQFTVIVTQNPKDFPFFRLEFISVSFLSNFADQSLEDLSNFCLDGSKIV